MSEYSKCYACGSGVEERLIPYEYRLKGVLIVVIEDVPAIVCTKCGEIVFNCRVVKQIEDIALKRQGLKNAKYVPVVKFGEQEVQPV